MRRTFETAVSPLHHATFTMELLDCLNQLACNNDNTTNRFIPSLIAIAAERAREMADMLDNGEVQDDQ
ncbi:hypothetical protein [Buttiauxella massiliensis]|uniref:hypothetical protein n=1 Tax=Buttiauxella massiliensis TaxID=2831590 RepID=UPI00125F90B2|nr:hypothetical protein [Buttiauxella massiliensis]